MRARRAAAAGLAAPRASVADLVRELPVQASRRDGTGPGGLACRNDGVLGALMCRAYDKIGSRVGQSGWICRCASAASVLASSAAIPDRDALFLQRKG